MATSGLLGKSDEMPGDALCWIFIPSWENSNTGSFMVVINSSSLILSSRPCRSRRC